MRIRLSLIGSILTIAVLLAGCGDDDDTTADTNETVASDGAAATTTSRAPTATTAVSSADVNVASTSLGDVLVDRDGMTLYVFFNDTAGTSTCVDACAQTWPPLTATSVTVGEDLDEASFSLIARPDGTQQIAVDDEPLYLFAGDEAPGDTSGQGFNDVWYVVSPDGTPIEAS